MKTNSEITDSDIKKWKHQFGQVHKICPNVETPGVFCIVRHPKLEDIVMSAELGGDDEVKIGALQLNECWLGGDEAIRQDVELLRSAARKMGTIFKVYPSKIEFIPETKELLQQLPDAKKDLVKVGDELRKITVVVDGVEKCAWLLKPSMKTVEATQLAKNIVEQGTIFLQECWLFGDEELKSGNDEIRFAAYLQSLNLIRRFTASVEKL